MYLFEVEGLALTASFRVPETHTFHQTLPLPPKTTLIGMLGSALGFGLEEVHTFVEENEIKMGVIGTHQGLMRDLWNYRKITTKKLDEKKIKDRAHFSVLIREYLVNCRFLIVVGTEARDIAERCRTAFSSPHYSLTAGNSDDLLKIRHISHVEEQEPSDCKAFEHTIIPGNIYKQYMPSSLEDLAKDLHITESVSAPQLFRLPTKFIFTGEERRVLRREEFTFVGPRVSLDTPYKAYIAQGKGVVLH